MPLADCAVKVIKENDFVRIRDEVAALADLDGHPNVVGLLDVMEDGDGMLPRVDSKEFSRPICTLAIQNDTDIPIFTRNIRKIDLVRLTVHHHLLRFILNFGITQKI